MKLKCLDCGWIGFQEECIKTFEPVPFTGGDVEPCFECPHCNGRDLDEIARVGDEVHISHPSLKDRIMNMGTMDTWK